MLIKWKGHPPSETTWEHYHDIVTVFPDFHLADKVPLDGEGSVMDPVSQRPNIVYTYARRGKQQ